MSAPFRTYYPDDPSDGHLELTLRTQLRSREQRCIIRHLSLPSKSIDFSSNDFLGLAQSTLLRNEFITQLAELAELNAEKPSGIAAPALTIAPTPTQTSPSTPLSSLSLSACTSAFSPASFQDLTAQKFPLGSGGSRLLTGNSRYAEQLEARIARFHRAPTALLCNSGFDANVSVFSSIPQQGDVVICDELIHASCREGLRLCRATYHLFFAHNDPLDLKRKIQQALDENPQLAKGTATLFVGVETVYSMDGDVVPLASIVDVVEKALPLGNAKMIVDEAHATGVFGPRGEGVVVQAGLEDRMFIRVHTYGKAMAATGAVILSSDLVKEYLINYARPLIYTTFMAYPSLALIQASYSLLERGHTQPLVRHLETLRRTFYDELQLIQKEFPHVVATISNINEAKAVMGGHEIVAEGASSSTLASSPSRNLLCVPATVPESPIVPLLTPHPVLLAAKCREAGFVALPIFFPTVPTGTERVRVCLNATHKTSDVQALIRVVRLWVKQCSLQSQIVRASL